MRAAEFLAVLDQYDRVHRKWLFTVHDLRTLFPQGTEGGFRNQLSCLVNHGYIRRVCRGVYANHRARSAQLARHRTAAFLRPRELVYVSRESRLCDLGLISQQMPDYLTVSTTGRSRLFTTCFGRIEYTHTRRDVNAILPHLTLNPIHGLLEADASLAWEELRQSGRNTDLVEEQVAKYDDVQLPV